MSLGESALGIGESESLSPSPLLWLESRAKVNTRNLFPLPGREQPVLSQSPLAVRTLGSIWGTFVRERGPQ